MHVRSIIAFGALLTVPVIALAQMDGGMGMDMGPMLPPGEATEATAALMQAHQDMIESMHVQLTGNPDRDFALMMIPHHQGAIDMAEVELEFGTDTELRAMAEAIIQAQEAEIAAFQAWLDANP